MPIKTANDGDAPVGSDPYALTADLKKLAESLKTVIPITDAAELAALPGLFPGGVLPDGTTIRREDLDGQILSWSAAKQAWRPPGPRVITGTAVRIGDSAGLTGALLAGTIVPLIQAGSIDVNTDASGYFSFDFPVPFPNGIMTTIFGNGSSGGTGRDIIFSVASIFTNTKARVYGSAVNSAGVAKASSAARVEYIAVGW